MPGNRRARRRWRGWRHEADGGVLAGWLVPVAIGDRASTKSADEFNQEDERR